ANTFVVGTRKVQVLGREIELVFGHGFGCVEDLLFDCADLAVDGGRESGGGRRALRRGGGLSEGAEGKDERGCEHSEWFHVRGLLCGRVLDGGSVPRFG